MVQRRMVQGKTTDLHTILTINDELSKMLNIQRFVFNPYQENTYVVNDETHECVIIDCGAFFEDERLAVTEYISRNGLLPKHLLCTHGHFDHCVGNGLILQNYGLLPELNMADEPLLRNLDEQIRMFLGGEFQDLSASSMNVHFLPLSPKTSVDFGTHHFVVLETPGHTPGGVTFYCEEEKVAFTGDTLFRMSIGRTDFKEGNDIDMYNTLHNVIAHLPQDTEIWSGHGPRTTLGEELSMNPFLR